MSGSENIGNTGSAPGGATRGTGARRSRTNGGDAVGTESTSIHRLLDEAFAGVAVTPETTDLKEEIRGNLADRAAELQARGLTSGQAAATAFAELGDIRELLGDDALDRRGSAAGSGAGPVRGLGAAAESAFRLNHVRPNAAFVVRTVILSLILAGAVALAVCAVAGAEWMTAGLTTACITIATLAVGLIVADSLRQTTSQHYPVPRPRAVAYGLSAAAMLLGLLLGAVFIGDTNALAALIAGVLLVVAAIVSFTWLGVTQTNRSKPWVQAMREQYIAEDRFTQDPAAAARFGIYTVVIWVLALALFVILSLTVGFLWSWLALLGGLAVFMFTLARMLFAEH